jgi:hypothetical protein
MLNQMAVPMKMIPVMQAIRPRIGPSVGKSIVSNIFVTTNTQVIEERIDSERIEREGAAVTCNLETCITWSCSFELQPLDA